MKIGIGLLALAGIVTASAVPVRAEDTLRVAYAGSMGVVMDKALGPAFAKSNNMSYEGQGQGAYALARLLASRKIAADVFVSITPGPMEILKKAGLIDNAVPVASTSMVIAYNPRGKFADAFKASADPKQQPWWKVLQSPGLKFGRTDPVGDPQGQNIIFTMQLAEKYYEQPGLTHAVLGDTMNPDQVYGEGGLLTRLEAGQVDASSGYESAVISAKLPYITLPDEINLSNPAFAKDWYDSAGFSIKDPDGKEKELHPEALVFYAAVLTNAPHASAAEGFVDFMKSSAGQALFAQNGYGKPKGDPLYSR